jgi:peroxiredoxin
VIDRLLDRLAVARQGRLMLAAVLLLGAGWIAGTRQAPGAEGETSVGPREGFAAPEFALPMLDGTTIRLSDLRGRAVILNVWASWCPPCRAEMPELQRLHEAGEGRGFVVLAVNSTVQDSEAEARAFTDARGLTLPIALDVSGEVTRSYEVRALPTTFFIDAEGIVRRVVLGGPLSRAALETLARQTQGGGG